MERDPQTGLCPAEAFDWRTGRTWGVVLGSALGVALAAATCVWLVEVALFRHLDVDLPPWHRAALLLGSFLPAILGLAWLSAAGRETDREPPGREAKPPPSHPTIDLLWLATTLVVFYVSTMTALGLPLGAAIRDGGLIVVITAIAQIIVLRPIFLPGLLERWAARKAMEHR